MRIFNLFASQWLYEFSPLHLLMLLKYLKSLLLSTIFKLCSPDILANMGEYLMLSLQLGNLWRMPLMIRIYSTKTNCLCRQKENSECVSCASERSLSSHSCMWCEHLVGMYSHLDSAPKDTSVLSGLPLNTWVSSLGYCYCKETPWLKQLGEGLWFMRTHRSPSVEEPG